MLERQLYGVPNTPDLLVKPADVVESDIRGLLQHQIGILLRRQHVEHETAGGISQHTVAGFQRRFERHRRRTDDLQGSAGIGDQYAAVREHLLDVQHGTETVCVPAANDHHILVKQYRIPRLQARCLQGRRDGDNHAAGTGKDLRARVLNA